MKKIAIWISVAIVAVVVLLLFSYSQGKGRKGQIKIDAGGAAAKLQLGGGLFNKATINSGAEPTKVSARAHRPQHLSLSMKQNGNTWQIDSSGPWGKLSTIKVRKNSTTVLELGQSFLIKPSVSKSGSQVSIGLSIIGRAGEHYSAEITKNGKRLPTPKLKIVDETGNVLTSGKFEYG
jgi:hypothetical protein